MYLGPKFFSESSKYQETPVKPNICLGSTITIKYHKKSINIFVGMKYWDQMPEKNENHHSASTAQLSHTRGVELP